MPIDAMSVLVVGDTPRDVEAARYAGAISVAVASGHFSKEELAAAGADHVLGSLEEGMPLGGRALGPGPRARGRGKRRHEASRL